MQTHTHYRSVQRVLIATLILNWLVAAAKITFGLLSRCQSMTADGFHSLSDGASNIIGLIGIAFAGRPTDSDHPYGHKKYETFFSLGIGIMILIVSFNLGRQGLLRLRNPVAPEINLTSFIVMLVTLGVNIAVMRFEHGLGIKWHSDILVSDALHTKADIFTSLAVIISLFVIRAGFPLIDPIVTIIIAFFIAYSGIKIIKSSSDVLCDAAAIIDVNKITAIVLGIKGVDNCHKIRTRGRADDIHVDLHVQVRPDMRMDQAHQLSYLIEEEIKKGISGVTDVVVHMEPNNSR
jgi:cation diffusion facilitator family transporter